MTRRTLEGQGLVEYALIILLVAIALAGALGVLATDLASAYGDIAGAIP
jgi:Flp pilus assembly pilin Flp